jgi:hypothetical protein
VSNTVAEEDVVAHGEMVLSNAACKITGGTVASIQRIENEREIEFKYSKWKRVEIIPRSNSQPATKLGKYTTPAYRQPPISPKHAQLASSPLP